MMTSEVISILRLEFRSRQGVNQRYSLRAFARDLKVAPSTLSELFSGKHALSAKKVELIATRLRLNGAERERVIAHAAQKGRDRLNLLTNAQQGRMIDASHFVLLELLQLSGNQRLLIKEFQNRWGLGQTEVKAKIDDLEELGLLRFDRALRRYEVLSTANRTGDQRSSVEVRSLHRQILSRAIEALVEAGPEDRESRAAVFRVDSKQIPRLKKAIGQFQAELLALARQSSLAKGNDRKCIMICTQQLFKVVG
jgi:transcriptional regulator with XRE-family HTH domain